MSQSSRVDRAADGPLAPTSRAHDFRPWCRWRPRTCDGAMEVPAPSGYERLTSADRMYLALQASTVPEQFGAVLVLDAGGDLEEQLVLRALRTRVLAVPRLRKRIMRVPRGWGTQVWVDDPGFRIERHVEVMPCSAPGDEEALLGVAAAVVTDPLAV